MILFYCNTKQTIFTRPFPLWVFAFGPHGTAAPRWGRFPSACAPLWEAFFCPNQFPRLPGYGQSFSRRSFSCRCASFHRPASVCIQFAISVIMLFSIVRDSNREAGIFVLSPHPRPPSPGLRFAVPRPHSTPDVSLSRKCLTN